MSNPTIRSLGLEAICRVQNTQSPKAAIRGACLYLLKACGVTKPPIPLKPLLKTLDVVFSWSKTSRNWRPGQSSATLQSVNGHLTIFIHESSARSNWRRTRFTIAHELVHALIVRMLGNADLIATLDDTEESHAELEKICNVGAAELLMPSSMMRKSVPEFGLSPEGLLQLYDHFLVSREAMLWRIAATMPHSSIIRWREHARDWSEAKCFRVVSCYPPYERGHTRPWLPEGATTRHLTGDVVERVAAQKKYERVNELEIELGEKSWTCEGLATFFAPRKREEKQPQFEGFVIPDEKVEAKGTDVLLFVTKQQVGNKSAA
jgi:Zn-dependent peptidase ImmA (M78 family)